MKGYLEKLIRKLKLENNIKLLGFRKDIYEIYKISDVFVFPSKREGLSVALMEALVCELPVICSDIRGNRDLINDGKNGWLVNNSKKIYSKKIKKLLEERKENQNKDTEIINLKNIKIKLRKIYEI